MNWLMKVAIIVGLSKIDNSKVQKWIRNKNVELLAFTLKKGLYPERIQAIKGLTKIGDQSIISVLLLVGRNDFEVVAKEAILAIEALDHSSLYVSEVDGLKEYWKNKDQQNRKHRKKEQNRVDKRSRMKNLERVRQQLKRPMSGGKWF